MSIQRIALHNIVANRYRRIGHYRISETKIDALIQSYATSGFWDGSIQARPHPTRAGKYEIAFGHHRIEAAKRAKLHDVGLVVAARSDADMLRMMADENREEFKGDALVQIETIAATIEAFGRGEIELEAVDTGHTNARDRHDLPGGKSYTLGTVARFLAWVKPSDGQATNATRDAFDAYHEKANIVPALQQLPEDDRTRQSTRAVVKAARTARKLAAGAGQSAPAQEAAAKRAAKEAVRQIKAGEIATRVKDHATKIGREASGITRTPVEISQFVRQRAEGLRQRSIGMTSEVDALMVDIWPYRDQIDEPAQQFLLKVLEEADKRMSGLFRNWITKFTARTVRNITPQQKRLKEAGA